MDKAKLHHNWTKVRKFRPVYFAILFIICALVCLFALRHNNLQMAQLRDQVYAADKSGQGVEQALQKLQKYVTSHMNTDLSSENGINPPIQLRYTYEREKDNAVQGISKSNSELYTRAEKYCKAKFPNAYLSYVKCNQDYLNSHNINIKIGNAPPDALYKLDFASPAWSSDLAGWSLVASVLFLILTVLSILIDFWFKRVLKTKA